MNRFSIDIEIDAPPQRVWDVMIQVQRWHEWTASVRRIKPLSRAPFAIGSRYLILQPRLPPAVWKVTELTPGRSFTWRTGGAGMSVAGTHTVQPSGVGSRASLLLQFSGMLGPALAWMTRNINNRYLNLEANGLKRRSEHPT